MSARATLWVGTYAEAGGRGLVRLDYDADAGFSMGEAFEDARNASFGAWSPRHRLLYLVDEQAQGAITVCRRTDAGWARVASCSTGGAEPCFVALDAAEQRLAVANYGSGSVARFDLGADGLPQFAGLWTSEGRGPDPERQEAPHLHCTRFAPDNVLHAVDLGTDRVLRLADASARCTTAYRAPPGSGPRHLIFHPDGRSALLVSELASTLDLLAIEGEALVPRRRCSTLPHDFRGESLGGHLASNAAGDRVYVTNRGHDSIAVFRLDAGSGVLELLQHVPSGGASPRFFLLLPQIARLIVANEEAGSIAALAVDRDGTLAPLDQQVVVPGAAFLLCDPR